MVVAPTVFLKAGVMVRTKTTFVVFVSVPIFLTISRVLALRLLRMVIGLLLVALLTLLFVLLSLDLLLMLILVLLLLAFGLLLRMFLLVLFLALRLLL